MGHGIPWSPVGCGCVEGPRGQMGMVGSVDVNSGVEDTRAKHAFARGCRERGRRAIFAWRVLLHERLLFGVSQCATGHRVRRDVRGLQAV